MTRTLVGLRGVVKIGHALINGISLLNLDGFAPASKWENLSRALPASVVQPEATRCPTATPRSVST